MGRKLLPSFSPYELSIGFSRAARVHNFVSVSGTAAIGPDGNTVGAGDVSAQARRCLNIIRAAHWRT
jgi:enamine deaminase RidA (YjgF/YER057c/UK114 family)